MIIYNNKTITNPADIAEKLNSYFINIGPNLAKKLKADPSISPTQYITHSPLSSFVMSPVSESQVFTLFANLDDNK